MVEKFSTQMCNDIYLYRVTIYIIVKFKSHFFESHIQINVCLLIKKKNKNKRKEKTSSKERKFWGKKTERWPNNPCSSSHVSCV